MTSGGRLPDRVRRLFRLPATRERLLREMDEEMQIHLAMRIDDLRAAGLSESEARAEAVRRFGDSQELLADLDRRVRRRERVMNVARWLAEFGQDVRFACRQFGKNRAFTALAVLTLALGIGANTAIFSVVHRLLIAPLPYPDGDRIVRLMVKDGENLQRASRAMLKVWRTRSRSIEMFASADVDALYMQHFERSDTVRAYITANFLDVLGIRPALGRGFTLEDEQHGASVAMISYARWKQSHAGRTDVIGSTLRIDDRAYTIVGVTPPEMGIPMRLDSFNGDIHQADPGIWIPMPLDSTSTDDIIAKLRTGISPRQATIELQALLDTVPAKAGSMRVQVMRAQDFLDPRETQTVRVLFVAVGVLLLIACANVASLLVSRAWSRRREFAVRMALGAGRGRVLRLVLTESVLLALAGGLAGVGVAWATLKIVIALRPPALAHLDGVQVESPVLLWSAAISIATGLLFGCAPAVLARARHVGDVLRDTTRTSSGGTTARRLRSSLIVFEIAMSLVLLVGAGLLVRSFIALQRTPIGFEPRGLAYAEVMVRFRREWSSEYRAKLREAVADRLRATPGMTEVAFGMMPGAGWGGRDLESEPDASGTSTTVPQFTTSFVTPNFFRVARIPIVEGRLPDGIGSTSAGTRVQAPVEVVVSRKLARRFWPDGSALGRRLYVDRGRPTAATYIIVGIVDGIQMPGPRLAVRDFELYMPIPWRISTAPLLVRTTLPPEEIAPTIRRAVGDVDWQGLGAGTEQWNTLVRTVTVGETYLRDALAPARFAMALLGAFSIIALVLSGVGLYAVVAYAVTQRTHEIGVRVALGASPRTVTQLVLGGGLRLAMFGIALGIGLAMLATRLLASMLHGVSPADPATFAVIALGVGGIAILASYLPARRAGRIDPLEALRAN